MIKEIQLTQNKVALIDDEDFELITRYNQFENNWGEEDENV